MVNREKDPETEKCVSAKSTDHRAYESHVKKRHRGMSYGEKR